MTFPLYRYAFYVSGVYALLAGCGASQPTTLAPSATVQSAVTSARPQAVSEYYLTKLSTRVGNSLPESSFCFRFKSNGRWRNEGGGSESFSGTYLTSGKSLYATAVWLDSPAAYLTLQGSIGTGHDSGHFTVSLYNATISGGGTYTMEAEQSSNCGSK